jgi:hypothetical protein
MNLGDLSWSNKPLKTVSGTIEVSDTTRLIFEITIGEGTKKYLYKKEEWLRLHIRPKPKYLPNRIWRWLLLKLIYLDTFTKSVKEKRSVV